MTEDLANLLDIAFVSLVLFFVFFFGLILYLRKEDRREGYPLENELTGQPEDLSLAFVPAPKTFHRPTHGDVQAPDLEATERRHPLERLGYVPGSPYQPTGDDPMLDGVGPGSWAEREDVAEMDAEGHPKIEPMRKLPDFKVVEGDADPRGMSVVGCDGEVAGTVSDIWIDKPEALIRYLEVSVNGDDSKSVLLPITMAVIKSSRRKVVVDAIEGAQFAKVPGLANPDIVTKLEEEKIVAYYGAGFLYANPDRLESSL